MINQKGFAPLVIIVILIAVAVGGYFVVKSRIAIAPTQSPTPIASPLPSAYLNNGAIRYKTYVSTKYGFELNYPSEWLNPIISTSEDSVNLSFPIKNGEPFAIQMVNVTTWNSRGSVDANVTAFLADQAWHGIKWEKEFMVGNGKAFYYVNTSAKDTEPTVFLVGPSGIWLMAASGLENEDALISVASTFKFTK